MSRTPKRELKECTVHGSSAFPLAGYTCISKKLGINIGMHWHPEVEISRFESGDFVYNYAMKEHHIKAPAICVVPGNVLHNIMLEPGARQSSVVFNLKMLEFVLHDETLSRLRLALLGGGKQMPKLITQDMDYFEEADRLLSFIISNSSSKDGGIRLRVKAHLIEFMALMHEKGVLISSASSSSNEFESRQQKIKDLLSYINENCAGKLTMNEAAEHFGFSKQYFCRYFKKSTGMSFVDFVNDLRLRRASQEIALTQKSMTDIALDNGFDNIGYFFKLFHLKYGVTPRSYRLNLKNKEG